MHAYLIKVKTIYVACDEQKKFKKNPALWETALNRVMRRLVYIKMTYDVQ